MTDIIFNNKVIYSLNDTIHYEPLAVVYVDGKLYYVLHSEVDIMFKIRVYVKEIKEEL